MQHPQHQNITLQCRKSVLPSQGVEPDSHVLLTVRARYGKGVSVLGFMRRVRLRVDEVLDYGQVAEPCGHGQRRVLPGVCEVGVRVGFDESFHHLQVALLGSEVQAHAPIPPLDVDVGLALGDEPLHRGEVPTLGGHQHRCRSVGVVREVDLGMALADEQLHDVQVPVGRRHVRRRQAVVVGGVHPGLALGHEPPDHVEPIPLSREVQGRAVVLPLDVDGDFRVD
mmetsp:Transcript_32578/g.62845  ORF Transcript_32578/g.62845 Transcript_32578/m.62845 type:complete len:225 (+) Transcript_32578:385-1059(+)